MIKFNDYFNRKFYSKVGRATHASCRPQYIHLEPKDRAEITMDFVKDELTKAENESRLVRKKQKKRVVNSSSFLSPNRESFMKAFKSTSVDAPSPGRYSPNLNSIYPNEKPVPVLREEPKEKRQKVVVLPYCIDRNALECSYPAKRDREQFCIQQHELQKRSDFRRAQTPKAGKVANFVEFDKQSPRKFLPISPLSESRFEVVNYFPKISSKVRKSPVCDFSKVAERRERAQEFSPGPYDYNDKASKSSNILHSFDMRKITGRFLRDDSLLETQGASRFTSVYSKIVKSMHNGKPK